MWEKSKADVDKTLPAHLENKWFVLHSIPAEFSDVALVEEKKKTFSIYFEAVCSSFLKVIII